MGTAAVIGILLQLAQAGFSLMEIKRNVDTMAAAGATEEEIHIYLRKLAHDAQDKLEQS